MLGDEVEDRRLAELAAAGDDEAFAALVGRHRSTLVRFVARRTGRGTIAEDAVQEAMLSAHRALRDPAHPPPRDVKAWLHAIAWRRAVDLIRRESVASRTEWQAPRNAEGADVLVADAEELRQMLGHWRGLPHRQRHALAMRVLEGRSHEEIGAELGVSPDAAKSLVARSRRGLADRTGRRRRLLFIPPAMVERLREFATFATSHEQPVSLVTKVCAGTCAAALAGGGSAAVVAVAPPAAPLVTEAIEREAENKPRKQRRKILTAKATATATAQPVVTQAPRPTATAWPSTAQAGSGRTAESDRTATVRRTGRRPQPLPGGGSTGAAATPTPVPTPPAQPTPQPSPTAEPAG